ncbi:DUF3619 family protein [Curvibacter sp. PAE-UM]|uniref:DUF3619 family protein n=1 Tax=Curvibacter sp. PAE-UM TaxID=1714344 RepID=UPI000709C82C|nr:DUF3619 family protein [Curvibacter sp. PAE-UM]KRI00449.1 hypothetical protein AO057_13305 [Curvibacter sp. PAE-UM]
MKTMSVTANLSAQDRYGRQLAAYLDASAQQLPHDISERLRVARQQALGKYREVQVRETAGISLGGGVAALGGGEDERGLWPRLVSLIPLLALIAGLVTIQMVGTEQIAEELAELDAAILTDDLPPDAYSDPGFAQFLKARIDQLRQD